MSGANDSRTGLTRRSFLKSTAAVAAAAGVVGGATSLTALAQDYGAGQPENEGEQMAYAVPIASVSAM